VSANRSRLLKVTVANHVDLSEGFGYSHGGLHAICAVVYPLGTSMCMDALIVIDNLL
jgi:hypothetical protein